MTAAIPNRPVFRAQEVCDIAQVQLYVLRSWEAEFPDLGVSKKPGDQRVYRRADVERVLQLRHLLFVDGLTLAGARKRLGIDAASVPINVPAPKAPTAPHRPRAAAAPVPAADESDESAALDADIAAMLDAEARESLRSVRRGLHWILGVLDGLGAVSEDQLVLPRLAPARTTRRPAAGRARPRAVARKATRPVRRAAKGRRK